MKREVEVWADWREMDGPAPMGRLRAAETRGKEVFSFEYDKTWLAGDFSRELDPELQLFEGPQYTGSGERANFGVFLDSSPDRWGRLLMRRREAMLSRDEGRPERVPSELDYLLGVHDEQRSGALRFKNIETDSPWLSDDASMATPPWAMLRELERASWNYQGDRAQDDRQYREWLRVLLAPGSSIGGARPKAGVRDENENLWIAKFPGRGDFRDMAAWEMLARGLAVEAGLNMPEGRLERFGRGHRTFMTRRFDRVAGEKGEERIHFASAMTLLGRLDGDDSATGASYLELVEWIVRRGANVAGDLEELWRRIVFSIAIRNVDDHLRNHGFLLTREGWRLSPAYDINPDPLGRGLHLNISETDNSLSFELAMEVAPLFRLEAGRAAEILERVKSVVTEWRSRADDLGIPRSEQEDMAPAFWS